MKSVGSLMQIAVFLVSGAVLHLAESTASAQCYGDACYHGSCYTGFGHQQLFPCCTYGKWAYSNQLRGYYCQLSFRSHRGLANHLCVYYPDRYAGKAYFYDPSAKCYYGCYDYQAKGFCLLKHADRQPTIAAIPPAAFGQPGSLPRISDLAPSTPNGGFPALIGAEDRQISAPPALPQAEPDGAAPPSGIITPPIPAAPLDKIEPMADPSPLPIGQ